MRIISYNVNGIRAAIKKGFADWLKTDPADVICVQETKAQEDQVDKKLIEEAGYPYQYFRWHCTLRSCCARCYWCLPKHGHNQYSNHCSFTRHKCSWSQKTDWWFGIKSLFCNCIKRSSWFGYQSISLKLKGQSVKLFILKNSRIIRLFFFVQCPGISWPMIYGTNCI